MTGPVRTRRAERARRRVVLEQLLAAGHPERFVLDLVTRAKHHDELRRARAVVQAIAGYRSL